MSSPGSSSSGGQGFYSYPHITTLGYTNPRAQRLAASVSAQHSPKPDEDPHTFVRHRLRRGMSHDKMQTVISANERSISDFKDMPTEEGEIKAFPRKVRPYYRRMALIQEHYNEVDNLLSGELPSIIASSFFSPPDRRTKSYSSLSDVAGASPNWTLRNMPARDDGEEAGEATPLVIGEREANRARLAKLALNVNTVVNFLLVAAKCVAVWYSSSISLTASLVDSALDLLSTFIILGTSWAIGVPTERHRYPAGKRRFEPLGVLIFSVIMICSFVQVFIESLQRTIKAFHGKGEAVDLSWIGIATMLATIGVKGVLWVVHILLLIAQDAENDVFFNSLSLSFPYIGQRLGSNILDPIGGLVLSSYIIFEWIKTLLQNFANLSGKSASPDQYTRMLYLVSRFNPVLEISDLECYHIGDDLVVEVDVILPNTSLHFAHDVGETIQCMLENLDGVIRAYVHTDYSSSNPSQHTTRQPVPLRTLPENDANTMSGSATPKAAQFIHSNRSSFKGSEQPITEITSEHDDD